MSFMSCSRQTAVYKLLADVMKTVWRTCLLDSFGSEQYLKNLSSFFPPQVITGFNQPYSCGSINHGINWPVWHSRSQCAMKTQWKQQGGERTESEGQSGTLNEDKTIRWRGYGGVLLLSWVTTCNSKWVSHNPKQSMPTWKSVLWSIARTFGFLNFSIFATFYDIV